MAIKRNSCPLGKLSVLGSGHDVLDVPTKIIQLNSHIINNTTIIMRCAMLAMHTYGVQSYYHTFQDTCNNVNRIYPGEKFALFLGDEMGGPRSFPWTRFKIRCSNTHHRE